MSRVALPPSGSRPLRVEILSGRHAPWHREFTGSRITIGRAASADVRLHPTEDLAVARDIHARLVWNPLLAPGNASADASNPGSSQRGAWELEVVHPSGVYVLVNDPPPGNTLEHAAHIPAGGTVPLWTHAEFTLGEGGPRLRAALVDHALPSTVTARSARAAAPEVHVPRETLRLTRLTARKASLLVTLVVVLALAAGGAYWVLSNRTASQAQQTEALYSSLSEVKRLSDRQLAQVRDDLSHVSEGVQTAMAPILQAAAESVWMVGVVDASGNFTPMGTAWTVREKTLATNAHVAVALEELSGSIAGAQLVAKRQSADQPTLVLEKDMLVHPGYKEWDQRFNRQWRRLAGGERERLSLISPCDVAVLKVASGDPGKPLTLARILPEDKDAGKPVGYVGFPVEQISGLGSKHQVPGSLVGVTDYFGRSANAPADNLLLRFVAVAAGGASGSPLISSRGEVIGLLSAGDTDLTASGGRVAVGFTYAQRVDLLVELLDGRAPDAQEKRAEAWSKALEELAVTLPALLKEHAENELPVGDHVSVLEQAVEVAHGDADKGLQLALPVTADYTYVVAAAYDDRSDVVLAVFNDQGDKIIDEHGWLASGSFTAPADGSMTIMLAAPSAFNAKATGRLCVYRAKANP